MLKQQILFMITFRSRHWCPNSFLWFSRNCTTTRDLSMWEKIKATARATSLPGPKNRNYSTQENHSNPYYTSLYSSNLVVPTTYDDPIISKTRGLFRLTANETMQTGRNLNTHTTRNFPRTFIFNTTSTILSERWREYLNDHLAIVILAQRATFS